MDPNIDELNMFISEYDSQMRSREEGNFPTEYAYKVISCFKDNEDTRVYLVSDDYGAKRILKTCKGIRADLLEREYRILCRVSGSSFPSAIQFKRNGHEAWMLREYIAGESLATLAERDAMSLKEVLRRSMQVCALVKRLHTYGLVHRDIKPQNFIVTPLGELVLIDFDSVQEIDPYKNRDTVLFATVSSAAPEQYGAARSDWRTDVYGAGKLMLYLLTNDTEPARLTSCKVPHRLKRIILRCTRFDPDQRYESLDEVEKALRRSVGKPRKAVRLTCLALAVIVLATIPWISAEVKDYLASLPGTPAGTQDMNAPVRFKEPMIEQAVRLSLGVDDVKPLYMADLTRVFELNIAGQSVLSPAKASDWEYDAFNEPIMIGGSIQSLDDLSLLKNLKNVILDDQLITDLTPLSGLPIEYLSLQFNPVWDLTPLSECANLKHLRINDTKVTDLSPLHSFPSLVRLNINDCRGIMSFQSLRDTTISELLAMNVPARDIEYLEDLFLTELWISNLDSEQVDKVGALQSLNRLSLCYSHITSLGQLSSLTKMDSLEVVGSTVDSLEGGEALTALGFIGIQMTNVSNLTPLKNIPHLTFVMLGIGTQTITATDFTPLFEMPQLNEVNVNQEQAELIYAISLRPPFTVHILT